MKIAIAITWLRCGGAERAAVRIADGLAAAGHAVTLITLDSVAGDFFHAGTSVKRVGLDRMGASASPLQALSAHQERVRALRRAFLESGAEVVLAFTLEMNARAVAAAAPLGIPVVVSERIDPERHPFPLAWRILGRRAYRRAAAVVPNARHAEQWLRGWLDPGRVVRIPNMVELPAGFGLAGADPDLPAGPFALAMGRLAPQKGFDLLLRAFAGCRRARPWKLVILGEGPDRQRLELLARDLGLADRVLLPGTKPDPWGHLAAAGLFVLSSRYEGFPNALLEAMAAGLPCVSFDCWNGTEELIRDGLNGVLVPPGEVDRLAASIDGLIGDSRLRRALGSRAAEVLLEFSPARILRAWEHVLLRAAAREVQAA